MGQLAHRLLNRMLDEDGTFLQKLKTDPRRNAVANRLIEQYRTELIEQVERAIDERLSIVDEDAPYGSWGGIDAAAQPEPAGVRATVKEEWQGETKSRHPANQVLNPPRHVSPVSVLPSLNSLPEPESGLVDHLPLREGFGQRGIIESLSGLLVRARRFAMPAAAAVMGLTVWYIGRYLTSEP